MSEKRCTVCGIVKHLSDYGKNGRYLRSHCKSCEVVRVAKYYNPDIKRNYDRNYRERNRELIRKNKREYTRKKISTDPNYALMIALRRRMWAALKHKNKTGSAVHDLGCSISQFRVFIENQFDPGMSWDNYGEWHLDHVQPLSSFDLTDRSQFLVACNWLNYQPLWAKDNLSKGSLHNAT